MGNNRDELTKDFVNINPNIIDRCHFLIRGYEPEFYYWEIVIMIRKILMVSIAVFFSYDIQIQSLLATLLCVTALCVHALACPYVTDAMDGLELLSLFGSFCTCFFGQFLFTPSVNSLGKTIVSMAKSIMQKSAIVKAVRRQSYLTLNYNHYSHCMPRNLLKISQCEKCNTITIMILNMDKIIQQMKFYDRSITLFLFKI